MNQRGPPRCVPPYRTPTRSALCRGCAVDCGVTRFMIARSLIRLDEQTDGAMHIIKPDAERKAQICDEQVNARTEKAADLFRNIMLRHRAECSDIAQMRDSDPQSRDTASP